MIFRIGIENNNDDRTIAWALDYPGCFAYGEIARKRRGIFFKLLRSTELG